MGMHHEIGDLLESDCDYICHQVNCQGKMNSGRRKVTKFNYSFVSYSEPCACSSSE